MGFLAQPRGQGGAQDGRSFGAHASTVHDQETARAGFDRLAQGGTQGASRRGARETVEVDLEIGLDLAAAQGAQPSAVEARRPTVDAARTAVVEGQMRRRHVARHRTARTASAALASDPCDGSGAKRLMKAAFASVRA